MDTTSRGLWMVGLLVIADLSLLGAAPAAAAPVVVKIEHCPT